MGAMGLWITFRDKYGNIGHLLAFEWDESHSVLEVITKSNL